MNLQLINGNEIIDFLNKSYSNDDWFDSMLSNGFEFISQEITNHKDDNGEIYQKYKLKFRTYYNNWGTDTQLDDNTLFITEEDIWVSFDEPLSDDGTSDIITNLLKKWLPTHKFKEDNEEIFYQIIDNASKELSEVKYGLSKNHNIDNIIKSLEKAITYLK